MRLNSSEWLIGQGKRSGQQSQRENVTTTKRNCGNFRVW